MSNDRTYFLISVPDEFREKFIGFLRNLNRVNDGCPVIVEEVYIKSEYALVPKEDYLEG